MADRDDFLIGCNQLNLFINKDVFEKIDAYVALLKKWNHKINLIGPSTVQNIYTRHVLDSLQLVPHLSKNAKIADFGSGAGLPAVILSLFEGFEVHAFEIDTRKIAFLQEVVFVLGLKDSLFIHHGDLTQPEGALKRQFDVVTARAFGSLDFIFEHGEAYLREEGRYVLLRGEHYTQEAKNSKLIFSVTCTVFQSIIPYKGVVVTAVRFT